MKYRGINYDIGVRTISGGLTREHFNLNVVTKEMEIIRDDLHCNAVRISGFDIERIKNAAEIALQLGLTVFFSPAQPYKSQEETIQYIVDASVQAEKLRAEYSNVIFVLGCEFSVFTIGFVDAVSGEGRMKSLFSPFSLAKNMLHLKRTYNIRLHQFLSETTQRVRQQFHGLITYASGCWEKIDWKMFDLIGLDFYRSTFNKVAFVKDLRRYKKLGKPLCVMEFGCCAYKGAQNKGAIGWAIADWKKQVPEIKGNPVRDEDIQANYIKEHLRIFEEENITGAFVFTFVMYNYLHNENIKYDLDIASFGIVKPLRHQRNGGYQNLSWLPKQAFFELSNYYKNLAFLSNK